MKLNPWHSIWGVGIVIVGNSIGANDVLKYQKGTESLRSRSEFCQYIDKTNLQNASTHNQIETLPEMEFFSGESQRRDFIKVWNLQKTLSAYYNKKIAFKQIPRQLNRHLEEKAMNLKVEVRQVTKQLKALNKKYRFNTNPKIRKPALTNYQSWQIENEWPLQVKNLKDKIRRLNAKIDKLDQRIFSGREILNSILHLNAPLESQLVIEIILEESLFSSRVHFFPRWRTKDGKISEASDEPYLSVSSQFLPKESYLSLKRKKQPHSLNSYRNLASAVLDSPEVSHIGIEYLPSGRALITGSAQTGFLAARSPVVATSPTDITISGLLDFACFAEYSK